MLSIRTLTSLLLAVQLVAGSVFSDVIIAKMSYYRALAKANPLTWDSSVTPVALAQAINASLDYDPFSDKGQIIFAMGREDGGVPDIVNSTYFAVDHWWDMRHNYTNIDSDDYDEYTPFYPAWEFTQMVWDTNTKIGCAWSNFLLKRDEDTGTSLQLVCLLSPGGNKWQGWGAHVHCPDCVNVQPQTTTIPPPTMTFPDRRAVETDAGPTEAPVAKRESDATYAALAEHWKGEVERVEQYRGISAEEFLPGWKFQESSPS